MCRCTARLSIRCWAASPPAVCKPGDQLPTVRQLAVDLAINPNTVVRAYRELEIREVLATQQGTGTFITDKKPEKNELERQRRVGAARGRVAGESRRRRNHVAGTARLFQRAAERTEQENLSHVISNVNRFDLRGIRADESEARRSAPSAWRCSSICLAIGFGPSVYYKQSGAGSRSERRSACISCSRSRWRNNGRRPRCCGWAATSACAGRECSSSFR